MNEKIIHPYAYPPRLMKKSEAARYLGMSERTFDTRVLPFVAARKLSTTLVRYDIRDLDHWADQAGVSSPSLPEHGHSPCRETQKGSSNGAKSGTSKRPSGQGTEQEKFENLLDAARSQTPS